MSVKENVLKILLNSQNQYISGENLANILNVSRNSIWKAIKSLEKAGYTINATSNKGYALISSNDILSSTSIKNHIKNQDFFDITVLDEVTSTNTLIKERGNLGEHEGVTIVSGHQTNGRGRLGRNFHSPTDTGVYFSVLLRPKISADKAIFITTMASIAVSEAILEVIKKPAHIKWVNDIFVEDRKVCGILCEASLSMENFDIDYVTLGIGINVYNPNNGFPEEISQIAGFLLEHRQEDIKNKLVASILNHFLELYTEFDTEKISAKYKTLSYVLNKEIFVIKDGEQKKALAIDIDNACGLVVKYDNNSIETLNSGEISTKIIN